MCASTSGETWRLPRSPSHESVTTDLSLFSVSSAASDAKLLRLLASKSGQGPDPSQRGTSPNPDCKLQKYTGMRPLQVRGSVSSGGGADDGCRELLAGCAALCAALGLQRSFSAGDVLGAEREAPIRSSTSEVALGAALEARALGAASRSCSTWVAVGGSRLPSPQRTAPPALLPRDLLPELNKKVRQNYIRRRLLTTYRALERLSQSEFNLDRLEAAAAVAASAAGPGPKTLCVPPPPGAAAAAGAAEAVARPGASSPRPADDAAPPEKYTALFPNAVHLALTAADLERERGRPLSKYERNMMIFNWLHTLDEAQM